ncbi:Vascular cell adhesion protein 1 [Merluccius polli]|uniref:B-cell receptor CD22 n=1 Tax=Merluccius polli TaxID=89951 RepID=A0AA47NVA9_MERPO|nr:Vascular cell adhesion protein 1 [Merluccius polli]
MALVQAALPPSPGALQGYDDWRVTYTSSNVCALRRSTVEISCTYKYPKEQDGRDTTVQKTLWFTKTYRGEYVDLRSDTDYAGRVEYICGENRCYSDSCYGKCTLRIRDLRLSDSAAEYKFQFITNQPDGKYTGDPGVKLSVTDLQVKVSIPDPTHPTLAELECHSMCGLADPYIWTRRGQSVGGGRYYRVDIRSEDIFSCAVEGYEHLPSPPVCKSTPQCTDIMPGPSAEIQEGSSVTLSCSSDANPAANYTWFKDNTDDSSRYMNQGQQLVFDGPKHTSVISSPSGGVKEGSSVTLSCSSDANPAANYTWFKEHEDSVIESGQDYTITNITSELGGNYYCQAHNAIGRHNSTFLSINLTERTNRAAGSAVSNQIRDSRSSTLWSTLRDPTLSVSKLLLLNLCVLSMMCFFFFTALQGNGDWTVTNTSSNVCALRGSTHHLQLRIP